MTYIIEEIAKNKDVTLKVLRYTDLDISEVDLTIFNTYELAEFSDFKSSKRQLEYYYARVLWLTFNQNECITYRKSGKPILNEFFISISHSHQQVAVAFSRTKEIGMDLEQKSEKVRKVKSKYLHPLEKYTSLHDLTIIWTIKEAIYKLYDSKLISFKRHIIITEITPKPLLSVMLGNNSVFPNITTIHLKENFIISLAQ